MAIKLIVRVDDCGQALIQDRPDEGLEIFSRWWDAGSWAMTPIYVGVVPVVVFPPAIVKMFGAELIALHGWDHADQPLSPDHIHLAHRALPSARVVIPPYNKYNEDTFRAMRDYGLTTLLGGFPSEHHQFGATPVMHAGILHLSARRGLYGRCYELVDAVKRVIATEDCPYPIQVVLHHRWDMSNPDFLPGVRKLRELIEPHVVTVDAARKWAEENQLKGRAT